ncbi:MAG: crossover junction endodeoxyribonuclease RuvC [Elusimicrobia bacterium]|nr:MAG: crossover junction endodeoxyribonuclease RuvC [Elusimicrobiota bacterium]
MKAAGGRTTQREDSCRILGIDPGTIHCGYGVLEAQRGAFMRPRYIECGVLELNPRQPLSERLVALAHDLREVLSELAPDEVALESLYHGVNAQSALRLGHARGVIMLVIAEAKLPLHEYPPATVKRTVAGNGRAQKVEVQRLVSYRCGLQQPPPLDASDALALALCHAQQRSLIHAAAARRSTTKPAVSPPRDSR